MSDNKIVIGKDYFGRDVFEGDLIVSKGTGRHSSMTHGVMLESGSIWTGSSCCGSSDKVKIDTTNDLEFERKRIQLIESRKEELQRQEDYKKKNKLNRFKKDQIHLYTAYDSDSTWSEIYCGTCDINGEVNDNVWLRVNEGYRKEDKGIFNVSLISNMYRYTKTLNKNGWRSVKNPTKTREVHIFNKSEVEALIKESLGDSNITFKLLN